MSEPRRVLQGIAASPGVAVGKAMVVSASRLLFARYHVTPQEVPAQLERLQCAIEASRRELSEIQERLGAGAPADYRLILDAHLVMHRDELLIDSARQALQSGLINAEWAVERAVRNIKHHLQQSPHEYFRERVADIDHVGRRIIDQLVGRSSALPALARDGVLVMDDLSPAEAGQLLTAPVAGLVTGLGTATSHTAILARTLAIPSVVGVTGVAQLVGNGDVLVVDALRGQVLLRAQGDEVQRAEERSHRYRQFTTRLRARDARAVTRDGTELVLQANVDLPEEVDGTIDEHVPGVGLYRTEFLFMNRMTPPDEQEQFIAYRRVAQAAAPHPVTLRSFDMGGDTLTAQEQAGHMAPNPALGLRAVRLALARPPLFRCQLRAVLRAARHGDVRLMFPLVSSVSEFERACDALQEARAELDARGEPYGSLKVGVMVEVPSAVLMADKLAARADFLAVGTNDLVQYTLAVDRANPQVAYLADALDPAVLRLLARVIEAGRQQGTPVSMCGDMAENPLALPIVLGLGFRSLSLPLAALPLARAVAANVDLPRATDVANRALECDSACDVRALLHEAFADDLRAIWTEAEVV